MNREDFPMLQKNIIYFDNGATTLKPKAVINKIVDYYENYSANAHRGDYDISLKVDEEYESTRDVVKDFINAEDRREIIFTSGSTDSLNLVVSGFMEHYLHENDEVLITKAEHASLVLPFMELSKRKHIKVNYIPLDENHLLSYESVVKSITPNTKVIALAHVTNVIGDIRPLEQIGALCKKNGIIFLVDGAQSTAHVKTDVKKNNIDFLTFSAHKMLGPTGVGVLYGKMKYLEEMYPTKFGGGMNQSFESTGDTVYKSVPTCFEAGTPPIAEVLGMKEAILYLERIGMENIQKQERMLHDYFLEQAKDIPNLILYNKESNGSIVAFNLDGVFSQDTAVYLNHYHICVRAGNHCAKILKDDLGISNTCRLSFYFYNTKEELDKLIEVLKNSKDLFKVVI